MSQQQGSRWQRDAQGSYDDYTTRDGIHYRVYDGQPPVQIAAPRSDNAPRTPQLRNVRLNQTGNQQQAVSPNDYTYREQDRNSEQQYQQPQQQYQQYQQYQQVDSQDRPQVSQVNDPAPNEGQGRSTRRRYSHTRSDRPAIARRDEPSRPEQHEGSDNEDEEVGDSGDNNDNAYRQEQAAVTGAIDAYDRLVRGGYTERQAMDTLIRSLMTNEGLSQPRAAGRALQLLRRGREQQARRARPR